MDDENGIYLMFLMHAEAGEPQPDTVEVDVARFFSLETLAELPTLQWLSRSIVTPILEGKQTLLPYLSLPNDIPIEKGVLYAGNTVQILLSKG
jgi:hypothetical protein